LLLLSLLLVRRQRLRCLSLLELAAGTAKAAARVAVREALGGRLRLLARSGELGAA
jgi:hypothetical protein